eukprot:4906049-Amphidinium_carterae.2
MSCQWTAHGHGCQGAFRSWVGAQHGQTTWAVSSSIFDWQMCFDGVLVDRSETLQFLREGEICRYQTKPGEPFFTDTARAYLARHCVQPLQTWMINLVCVGI